MTLSEFIDIGRRQGRANLHLKEPGFQIFYARYGRRWLGGKVYENVLDIASVVVKENLQRTGIFTRLVERIHRDYPDVSIYIENCAPALKDLLRKLQFSHQLNFAASELNPDCYYLLGKECSASMSTTGTTRVVGS